MVESEEFADSRAYAERLSDHIRGCVRNRSCDFVEIVRCCAGAYPTIVRDKLIDLGLQPKENTHLIYGPLKREDPKAHSLLDAIEGNPVLCSWYFTDDTCHRFSRLRDWAGLKLCFLGTPKLYEWFCLEKLGGNRVLLDLDSLVIERLSAQTRTADEVIIKYDTAQQIPHDLLDTFDCVFLDPPWYRNDYLLWLSRASSLASSGLVVFPMFPELTRPQSIFERFSILRILKEFTTDLTFLTGVIHYEIPKFEENQLKNSGIEISGFWKIADLVIAKFTRVMPTPKDVGGSTLAPWKEIDFDRLRVFVNITDVGTGTGPLLSAATENSIFLASPSRREPARNRSNVLTSRGHGLFTPRPLDLLRLLLELQALTDQGGSTSTAISQLECEPSTKGLLHTVFGED